MYTKSDRDIKCQKLECTKGDGGDVLFDVGTQAEHFQFGGH